MGLRDDLDVAAVRLAMKLRLPGRWFGPQADAARVRACHGTIGIEIVSHCWNYAHLLLYQLSSLVLHPPTRARVRMTVVHARSDAATVALLQHFGALQVPGVEWNWVALSPGEVFRRGIGRHRAASTTQADWIWFTDCDVIFGAGAIDALAGTVQGRRDWLLFPRQERVTPLLPADDPLVAARPPAVTAIDEARFSLIEQPGRAKGGYQIVHGDVARQVGYCGSIAVFQRPWPQFAKCWEDTAFRWLLGREGEAVDLPGLFRIRHAAKGRYTEGSAWTAVRRLVRNLRG